MVRETLEGIYKEEVIRMAKHITETTGRNKNVIVDVLGKEVGNL